DYKAMQEYSEKYGVELWSYHLPFQTTDIASADRAWRLCSMEYTFELIKQASVAGIHKFVAHASVEFNGDAARRAETLAITKDSLSQLADFAANYGSVICVEDLPRTCLGRDSDEILAMLAYDDRLRVCFDANHLFREKEADFVRKIGKKIATTHISDRDNINERHWLPGEGLVDWVSVMDALEEVGYDGNWIYEIGLSCPPTIYRDRDLTFSDFSRNAREVFARQTPTTFSRPKPGVGMWE
ncbi:MAG: sugar phosphate isomerase/epimerase, partial [Clostridia bacterium]|nr:sugar phosphate isomerase/epimerase [Clostridia bacterium]